MIVTGCETGTELEIVKIALFPSTTLLGETETVIVGVEVGVLLGVGVAVAVGLGVTVGVGVGVGFGFGGRLIGIVNFLFAEISHCRGFP